MFQSPDRPKLFGRPSLSKWVVPIDDTNTRKFGWRHFNDKDEALRNGRRDDVGWEAVDFYGQTGHRSYEEMQRNPGDWEAWVGQGPINVHARENLGTTDKGVALLRRKLRRDIRAVRAGDDIARPTGTETDPVRTYGGDTILRIPKRTDDEDGFLREIQHRVAEIYFAGDAFGGDERVEYIRRELGAALRGMSVSRRRGHDREADGCHGGEPSRCRARNVVGATHASPVLSRRFTNALRATHASPLRSFMNAPVENRQVVGSSKQARRTDIDRTPRLDRPYHGPEDGSEAPPARRKVAVEPRVAA